MGHAQNKAKINDAAVITAASHSFHNKEIPYYLIKRSFCVLT